MMWTLGSFDLMLIEMEPSRASEKQADLYWGFHLGRGSLLPQEDLRLAL